jgi:hypothetical protein
MKTYHRYTSFMGETHACEYYDHAGALLVFAECGMEVPNNHSQEIEDSTVTCHQCLALWTPWNGGEPPVANHEPVQMWWSNGIQRVYERGDWIMWHNLPTDGLVRWRKPL